MDQTETVIQVEGLTKKYGSFTAVKGIDFKVNQGEVFGLLGPNGAGKTTTMEMIEGLRKPDGGTAKVSGFDTRTELNKVKEVIGVQLQSTSLFDLLKVRELIQMYASFYPVSIPIEPLLKDMLLLEKAGDRVKNLSGGQKQRLAIALALINDPLVLFLDEPTTGLDPQARRTLWDIIIRLKEQGKTIILSTHYMDEAHILCDRICLMDQGQIIALDTPRNLVRSLQSESAIEFRLPEVLPEEQTAALLVKLAELQDVKQAEYRNEVFVLYSDDLQASLTDLIHKAPEHGIKLTDLQTRTATLEDVFIHMTGRSLRES
ncbi:ABC transporter ATP-binding protein [Paenibacillus sp. GP183]|uniref:ABC transporter ATP-binding protein n=1 Tax=Paenibacillus sp. GP183 TaxID=1882751 RepID=UPI00089738A4|nr:ABC transporter ATP-binding protein [Paenibacillus sp. GP183]SEC05083.1 ABC-2 type transport system ATP-binding protein [Paenibacillus sp. GP183]